MRLRILAIIASSSPDPSSPPQLPALIDLNINGKDLHESIISLKGRILYQLQQEGPKHFRAITFNYVSLLKVNERLPLLQDDRRFISNNHHQSLLQSIDAVKLPDNSQERIGDLFAELRTDEGQRGGGEGAHLIAYCQDGTGGGDNNNDLPTYASDGNNTAAVDLPVPIPIKAAGFNAYRSDLSSTPIVISETKNVNGNPFRPNEVGIEMRAMAPVGVTPLQTLQPPVRGNSSSGQSQVSPIFTSAVAAPYPGSGYLHDPVMSPIPEGKLIVSGVKPRKKKLCLWISLAAAAVILIAASIIIALVVIGKNNSNNNTSSSDGNAVGAAVAGGPGQVSGVPNPSGVTSSGAGAAGPMPTIAGTTSSETTSTSSVTGGTGSSDGSNGTGTRTTTTSGADTSSDTNQPNPPAATTTMATATGTATTTAPTVPPPTPNAAPPPQPLPPINPGTSAKLKFGTMCLQWDMKMANCNGNGIVTFTFSDTQRIVDTWRGANYCLVYVSTMLQLQACSFQIQVQEKWNIQPQVNGYQLQGFGGSCIGVQGNTPVGVPCDGHTLWNLA